MIAVSIVPAVLTMFALRAVREAAPREAPRSAPPPTRDLPRAFWALSAAWVVFSLGNSADVFLLLRARDLGLSATGVVVAYALYNTLYSGLSWPLGHLSDRIGRRRLLAAGLVVFAGVYAGFGLATGTAAMWPLFALYGCYMASDRRRRPRVRRRPLAGRAAGHGAGDVPPPDRRLGGRRQHRRRGALVDRRTGGRVRARGRSSGGGARRPHCLETAKQLAG